MPSDRLNKKKSLTPSLCYLPFTHATSWAKFCSILRDGYLRPAPCRIFGDDLVYFFCGTVARRASDISQPWGRSESPIILVFEPALLNRIRRFFPLDTGALAAGRLGDSRLWTKQDFRTELRIDVTTQNTPWQFIKTLYGKTSRYLAGEPISTSEWHSIPLESALRLVRESAHLNDVDYRRYSLECQATDVVPLQPYLREVWIPSVRKTEIKRFNDAQNIRYIIYKDGIPPQSIM